MEITISALNISNQDIFSMYCQRNSVTFFVPTGAAPVIWHSPAPYNKAAFEIRRSTACRPYGRLPPVRLPGPPACMPEAETDSPFLPDSTRGLFLDLTGYSYREPAAGLCCRDSRRSVMT